MSVFVLCFCSHMCVSVWVPPFENVCPPCIYKETECSSEYSHGAPPPQRAQTEEAGEVKVMLLQFMTLPSAIKAPHQLLVHLRCQTKSVFFFFCFLKNTHPIWMQDKKYGKSAADGGWACSISQPFNGFYCVCIEWWLGLDAFCWLTCAQPFCL